MRTPIKNLDDEALAAWLREHGQPGFRLGQIRQWLYGRWAEDFAAMANLPAALRQDLAADFAAFSLTIAERLEADDGTVKWLLRLLDGETIEAVLIRTPTRSTVCISTQVGCPVRCVFCASGRDGLVRDLQPAEIIDQVLLACRELGRRVDNVVVMGMGEPLLNFDAVVTALDRLQDAAGLGLGARHVTLSTSGIVPGMERLAHLRRQWHLALSLHAVSEAQRARLIPPRYRYALAEVLEACRLYRACTGRIVTLEYALMPGTNDSDADVRGLAAIARDLDARINLIPCNPVDATQTTPGAAAVRRFESAVRALGAKITVRQRKGDRIQAACGQLRRRPQDA
ncbi:MAG: 23S rRNA (adenine(2503)-C(2))-methyltransferase RlmN [Lentisphaerae bacterium]|nr:23S rRNA (adenine(2503)-C(2))-methyltransferase RlmN [Lentisphaerota bacterium]